MAAYFNEPDNTGHKYGPDSSNVRFVQAFWLLMLFS